MQLERDGDNDFATFEHLIPRSALLAVKHKVDRDRLVMLACERCNKLKKSCVADAEIVDYARGLFTDMARDIDLGVKVIAAINQFFSPATRFANPAIDAAPEGVTEW